jgi:hypothetical protein
MKEMLLLPVVLMRSVLLIWFFVVNIKIKDHATNSSNSLVTTYVEVLIFVNSHDGQRTENVYVEIKLRMRMSHDTTSLNFKSQLQPKKITTTNVQQLTSDITITQPQIYDRTRDYFNTSFISIVSETKNDRTTEESIAS